MIASFADHARKKEEKRDYDQLVGYFCRSMTQISSWKLIVSIANNVKQMAFANKEAIEIVEILSAEFGIRACGIQYFRTFSSAPSHRETEKVSSVIRLSFHTSDHKANNEGHIFALRCAIEDKIIEYREALSLVIIILENYPVAENHLQK